MCCRYYARLTSSSEIGGWRRIVEKIGALGRARAAGFKIRVMLTEVVLLMRGAFIAETHIFLLHLTFPPRLLPTFGRNFVLRGGLVVWNRVGGCAITVTVTRAKRGARLWMLRRRRAVLLLPQHAAQRTVLQRVSKISTGSRGRIRAPAPSAQIQVFVGLLSRRGG